MLSVTSPAFSDGQPIPTLYSCKGQSINPQLKISGVPAAAKSLALIMHDPDAPVPGGFTHWVVYNIPPQQQIAENSVPTGAEQGLNGSGKQAYTGPCPPSGVHRYYFYVYALDTDLRFSSPPKKDELEKSLQGHVLVEGQLMGTFAH